MKRLAELARGVIQWVVLGAAVGVLAGVASALFLWLLELATDLRTRHEQLVFALPLAGLAIGFIYQRIGRPIQAGNNLVIDTIHDEGPRIPLRMAPLVLIGTVLTHLFGGSAGREGTAVQMGASLADDLAHRLGLDARVRLQLLAAGVAGGFGSVFGTPIAGAVFGLEFVVLGVIRYDALLPALSAALVGDLVTRALGHALGVAHTAYPLLVEVPLSPLLLGKWLVFAAAMALATVVFIELLHLCKRAGARYLPSLPLRMAVGGVVVVALWQLVGTSDYLGLGVPTIVRSFGDPNLPVAAFAWKIVFTALTIGAGFLGGEVTPLFFVGAALGNVLARLLGLPIELGAGVGLAAVFAGAANTPLALSLMAVELLGRGAFPHVVIVCVLTYLFTGHRGIYPAQRLLTGKGGHRLAQPTPLRDLGAAGEKDQAPPAPPR